MPWKFLTFKYRHKTHLGTKGTKTICQTPRAQEELIKWDWTRKVKLVDKVMDTVQTSNIIEDNKLINWGTFIVTQLLGIKEIKKKNNEELFWKRRTEWMINTLRKDVNLIERLEERREKSYDKVR